VHRVFISYSTDDEQITKMICNALEKGGIPCWMAPRDILPGIHYSEAILDAISSANVLVLVFSSSANESGFVTRELERAVSFDLNILPIRIDKVDPSTRIEFYISINQWLDAHENAIDHYLDIIVEQTKKLLDMVEKQVNGKRLRRQRKTPSAPLHESHFLRWTRKQHNTSKPLKLKIIHKSKDTYYFGLVSGATGQIMEDKTVHFSPELVTTLGKAPFNSTVSTPRETWKKYAKIGNLLYRRILPTKIQDHIDNHEGGVILETDDLSFPWDLLHDERSFLCCNTPFSRLSMSTQWVNTIFQGDSGSRVSLGKMLIIADPNDNQPGSVEEAQELQRLFRKHGVNAEMLIGSSQCSYMHIKQILAERFFELIHIAGSLRYLPNRQTSALVLANEQLLTAEEICSLSPTPFVFLNVKHEAMNLDENDGNEWEYAPLNIRSMAQAFMYEGKGKKSVGVIGSMWGPMDTKLNLSFTKNFYTMLLSGIPLGDALTQSKCGNRDETSHGTGFVFIGDMDYCLTIETELKGEQSIPIESHSSQSIQDDQLLRASAQESTWSDDIRIALYGAVSVMQTMNWPVLSTVHLLLGLTYLPKGHLSLALAKEGFDPSQVRRSLRKILECKDVPAKKESFSCSDNLIGILKTAQQLSLDAGSNVVEELHLLLATFSQKKSGAVRILKTLKIDVDKLKQAIGFREKAVANGFGMVLFHEDGKLNRDLFEPHCYESLKISGKLAMKMNWDSIRTPHLFLGILNREGSDLQKCIRAMNLDYDLQDIFLQAFWQTRLKKSKLPALLNDTISGNLKNVIRRGYSLAHFANREIISECDLLEAMLFDSGNIVYKYLAHLKIDISAVLGKNMH